MTKKKIRFYNPGQENSKGAADDTAICGAFLFLEVSMSKVLSDIKGLLEDYEIKFIRLAFCDIFGRQKNIAIMADQLEHAVSYGVSFDASAIDGFMNVSESDLFLFPDLDTFSILPWRPSQSGVARFYCYINYPDGRPFEGDGRRLLADIEKKSREAGYSFLVGPECEFYLFETDEKGFPSRIPFDRAGYFDMAPLDRGENVRREICFALENMGIKPERSHHEHGPGQNEIDFRCSSPLKAADDLMTFKTAVKAIAQSNGLYASFLPKPMKGESGNGLHINLSVFEGERNLFNNFSSFPDRKASSFLAGILRRIGEISVFANPLANSYERLRKSEAPSSVCWSCQNRSTLVRVPAAKDMDSRMEVRSPDPSANPYLLISLLLASGFEGMSDGLEPCPPFEGNAYEPCEKKMEMLPGSLLDAVNAAGTSRFVSSILPGRILDSYLSAKKEEAEEYGNAKDAHQYAMDGFFAYV